MIWTEEIYLLISELISMHDRELAKRIDLAVFPNGHEPDEERLKDFLLMLNEAEDGSDFYRWSRDYLDRLPDLPLKRSNFQNHKPHPIFG